MVFSNRAVEMAAHHRQRAAPAEILGLPMAQSRDRARDLLALVGLAGNEAKYPLPALRRHAAARRDRPRAHPDPKLS